MRTRALLPLLALVPVATPTAAQDMPAAARAALDSLVDFLVEGEYVPGMGIAVVREGRIIYQRAAGWADREAGRRVDANTLFYTASVTKPFTALATALLDRAGVLDLDATLAQILPGAAWAPGIDPAAITVRQLLSHTHGISGNGPVIWRTAFSGEIDRAALFRALATHGPNGRGTAYRYTNLGYNILSLAIDSIAGKPWQDVLAERVFRPLGLTAISARVSDLPADRLAMPYRPEPVGMARLPYGKHDANMHAAGGTIASIGDLARFTIIMMDGGRIDGRQVLPPDVVAEVLRPHTHFTERFGQIQRFGYGLGWNYGTLDGDTLVHHLGGFAGFSAGISFEPAHRLGVVLAGNGVFANEVQTVVMGFAYALLNGNDSALAGHRSLLTRLPGLAERDRAGIASGRADRAARPQTTVLPLEAYVGRYENPLFGSIEVTLRDGRIHVRNGVLESEAAVYDGTAHQLRVELDPGSGSVLGFIVEDGRVIAARYADYRLARVR